MLKAIIFDCDGVIVDSEPLHLKAFQMTLAGYGILLTQEEYDQTYLAMDDKGCFETVMAAYHRPTDKTTIKKLIHQKMALYKIFSQQELYIYPGVSDLVKKIHRQYHLAIASGAFRGEIKFALDQAGIRSAFSVIVSAQDVKQGKPNPESFLTALAKLNQRYYSSAGVQQDFSGPTISGASVAPSTVKAGGASPPLIPLAVAAAECVVIEDSVHGITAARLAGMKSVAVTNSYSRERLLPFADRVVDSLEELTLNDLENLCKTN
ncbi:MAG: HAD family phosphatase [Nitrospirae bacterium]|nr:HAD family phosphatase [Candidatus Troglogloeales bacterium]